MFDFFKRNKYQTGLLAPDPADPRDYLLAEVQEPVPLPDKFDLRSKMGPIGHQNYGTCTAWSSTSLAEYWNGKEYKKQLDLSEKFVYHNIKKISGLWNIQGDYGRNGLKAICDFGVCELEDWPDIRDSSWEEYVKKEPPAEVYKKAEKYKGETYWRVGKGLEAVMQAIFQNNCPILTGIRWNEKYKPDKSGKLPLPSSKEGDGHSISCVDWEYEGLWLRNSWGKNWGAGGYFYVPFKEFDKHEWWDFWVITDLENPEIENTGWVASSYLEKSFKKGDVVWPSYRLNFRKSPWGEKIKTLEPGEKLEILGEKVEKGNVNWEKVKLLE